MSQYNTGFKAFTSGEALATRCRVKKSGATVVYAGAGEDFIGVTEHACASGEVVTVKLKNVSGTFKVVASEAFAVNTVLYGAASGKVADTESGSAQFYSLEAAGANGDVVEALPWAATPGIGSVDIDAGHNLTLGAFNSTLKGYGAPLSASNSGDVRFYSDDNGAAFAAGSVPDVKGMISRVLVTCSQATNPVRIYGAMGHVKSYANGTAKLAEWDNEQVAGTYGYLELVRNAGTIAFEGYGVSAGLMGCVEAVGTMTLSANHKICGCAVISKIQSGMTQTGKTCAFYAGIYDTTNWSDGSAAPTPWGFGLYMPRGAVVQGIRVGDWVGSGAAGSAILFGTGMNFYADGQLDVVGVYGESTTDLTSAYSAKAGRFRHLIVGSSVQVNHETYGLVGQLVGKSCSLLHMHAGLMGTLEANTTAVVANGAYAYSVAAVIARVGGGGLITATKPVAGFSAILNGAAMASGSSVAYASCITSTGQWTYWGALSGCDNVFYAAAGVSYEHGIKIGAITNISTTASGVMRMVVGSTIYYVPLWAAAQLDGE